MMQASTLRAHAVERALAFCWDSWAQMGLAHTTDVRDPRAADPEALLVFTLEVARDDPRLFDETLDWLRENERLISVQRLRNLAREPADRRLVQAALAWVSRYRSNPRFLSAVPDDAVGREALFTGSGAADRGGDPAFLAHGFVRGAAEPSRKSRRPDVTLPVNLAFRLRLAFGVGSRAEVIRYLLTMPGSDASAQQIAHATAFAKRNVAETLDALVTAGLMNAPAVASDRRYSLDRSAWASLLGLDERALPEQRAWPQLLGALRTMLRFLADPGLDDLSGYMRASSARDVLDAVAPDLQLAGVSLSPGLTGEAHWEGFVRATADALAALRA